MQSRLIGASIRNGDQVAFLAGLDVLTIPPKAIKEFQDSGKGRRPGIDATIPKTVRAFWY